MSPARLTRPVSSPSCVQMRTARAICARDHDGRRVSARRVDRQRPGIGLVVLLAAARSATARRGRAPAAVRSRAPCRSPRPRRTEPRKWRSTDEGRVDRREHRLGGAEGEGQAHVLEARARRLRPCPATDAGSSRTRAARRPGSRRSTASDRRPRRACAPSRAARAAAGREILGDVAQDLPLLRVRVLRLVDEHVVDAAVELVEHPGRVAAPRAAPASWR